MAMFEYPVMITAEDIKNECGFDLVEEYGASNVPHFLALVHSSVYDGCIYATGMSDIKDRIINKFKSDCEIPIKRALVTQAAYINSQGHIGTESGITITADGQKAVVNKFELRSKNVALGALDILKACKIPLLYAGEGE